MSGFTECSICIKDHVVVPLHPEGNSMVCPFFESVFKNLVEVKNIFYFKIFCNKIFVTKIYLLISAVTVNYLYYQILLFSFILMPKNESGEQN